MVLKEKHKLAMQYSFEAKQAISKGYYTDSLSFYIKAAELESSVADFYIDRLDLEPTRSIIISSAAHLNVKAGRIDCAKKYISHISEPDIVEKLNEAIEKITPNIKGE